MLIDSHCHLDAAAFDADRKEALLRARDAGVSAIVVPAVGEETWNPILELCRSRMPGPALFPALGIHPIALPFMDAREDARVLERLRERALVAQRVRSKGIHGLGSEFLPAADGSSDSGIRTGAPLETGAPVEAGSPRGTGSQKKDGSPSENGSWPTDVTLAAASDSRRRESEIFWAAIGECGLDSTIDLEAAPLDRQEAMLRGHIAIAKEVDLPLIIHCRGPHCHQKLLDILADEGISGAGGVVHSYSGGVDFLKRLLEYPLFFGFAGPATWQNARKVRASIQSLPLDRLLVETDAPDQTPEPHRPGRNEPAFLPHIVAGIAQSRGESVEVVAEASTENARRLFRLNLG